MLDRMYTMAEAAKYFRVSRRLFQDVIQRYPFYRVIGRRKIFSESDLQRIADALASPRDRSVARRAAAKKISSAPRQSNENTLTQLQELLKSKRPTSTALAGRTAK